MSTKPGGREYNGAWVIEKKVCFSAPNLTVLKTRLANPYKSSLFAHTRYLSPQRVVILHFNYLSFDPVRAEFCQLFLHPNEK